MKIFHFKKESCFDIIIIIRPCYSFQFSHFFPFFCFVYWNHHNTIKRNYLRRKQHFITREVPKAFTRYIFSNMNATRPDVFDERMKRKEIETLRVNKSYLVNKRNSKNLFRVYTATCYFIFTHNYFQIGIALDAKLLWICKHSYLSFKCFESQQ